MARSIKISDTPVQIAPNWSISDKINSISTMGFTITDLLTLAEINIGDSVEFFDGTTKIFSGIIKSISEYEPDYNRLQYSVQASDNNALADKRLIASNTIDTTAGDIVTNEILPILAEEGVTAGTIDCDIVIKKATFNRIKVSEALDQLKDLTGYIWDIDKEKTLNFIDPSTNAADFELTSDIQHKSFSRVRNLNTYRNVQYVRGGKGQTSTQSNESPTPEPDGISRKFITRFPLAEKPTITINSVEVDEDDIGINGLDTNKKWYFTYNSNIITQDEAESVLTSADTIDITYKGLYDLLSLVESIGEIEERATAEAGTSGKYEILNEEKSIDESGQATQYAEALIDKYAKITNKISFTTEYGQVRAGELLTVTKPLYGIDESFLIESVNISAADSETIQYQVSGLSGESIGGWEEFFKQIINTGKTYVIGQNEVLIILNRTDEALGVRGQYGIKVINADNLIIPFIISDDKIIGEITQTTTIVETLAGDVSNTVSGELITDETSDEPSSYVGEYNLEITTYGVICSDSAIISDGLIITKTITEVTVND